MSSFNQATFRDALAIQMGVSPSAIMLAVTAASVAVTATIQYPTPAAAVAAATTLTTTSVSALSAALGSNVLAVGNVALTLVAPPPSPPPPSPPSRPTLAQSLMHFGGRWSPKTTLRMATVDQQLERLYPYALLSLAASVLVLGFFCGKDGGRALKDTPLLPPSAHRSGLRSRAVLSTTLRRRLTSFMDLPSDARLPIGKAQEVITRSPCVHQTTSDSRLPWTTTTPSSLPSVHSQPSGSQMPFGAPFPSPVWAAAPPAPPPRSPRTSSGFTPRLLPHATVSTASACAAMAMAQAASERARQAVERADTASIQAAVREAETAALALMMIVQDAGERSPGRGSPPEPPPMLQDRASPAARMDTGGKGSLIGDARIEGDDDDDDDDDEHAPMRPRHASARAAVPAAVQPAALTRPTALQLQHESQLAIELDRAWRAEAEVAQQAAPKEKPEAAVTTVDGKAEAATAAPREAAPVEVTMAGAISEGSPGRGPTGPPPEPPPRSRDRASPALVVMAVAPPPWPGGGGGAFSPAPWPKPPGVPHLARAAVLEELETKLSLTNLSRRQMVGAIAAAAAEEEGGAMVEAQGMAMEAVAARGGLASEAPGTTEIAYEWLGREMARATRDSGERDEERVRITSQIEDGGLKSVGDIMTVKEGVQLRVSHVDKDKKALVGTASFARGKRRHGCASTAGASPCRSSLATVAEQAEEPSLAEESSASLVASEEEQQQEASLPSPSQTPRQLTLLAVSPWVEQPEKPKGGGEGGTEGGRSGGFGIEGWTYASDGSHELGSLTEEDLASLAASEEFKSPFDFAMARSAMVAAKKAKKEKHVVVTIDPSRSDVHNAAANLQRVRSSKALAAATSPISSVSFGLAGLEGSPFRRASLVELTHFS